MNGAVHGLAGLGALFWANVHGAPPIQSHQLPAHKEQPRAQAAQTTPKAVAKPTAAPKPIPHVDASQSAAQDQPIFTLPAMTALPAPTADEQVAFAPLPRPRPGTEAAPVSALDDDERGAFRAARIDVAVAVPAALPLPRTRPSASQVAATDPFADYGGSKPAAIDMLTAFLPPPEMQHITPDDDSACRSRLDALGVKYVPQDGIAFASNACTVVGPLKVSAVGPGLALSPAATMNCRTTEALAKWMRDVVAPAAQEHLNATPTGITQASTFVCRPRNNVAGAKISEHATGNAVDVAAIGLQGQSPFAIHAWSDDQPDERDFQAAIRKGACGVFTTVLGPGTNPEHATHFHLDLAQRRGGSTVCE